MKKYLILLLCVVCLAGCGSTQKQKSENATSDTLVIPSESSEENIPMDQDVVESSEVIESAPSELQDITDNVGHEAYSIGANNIELGSLEMIQSDGDDTAVAEALEPYYADAEKSASIFFEDWDDSFYYLEDYTNGTLWKVNRITFEVSQGWD